MSEYQCYEFEDSELEEDSVVRNFRIAAGDGKTYDTKHDNLSVIIAVGYKVNSERAVQFRQWATRVVEEFTIKGFAMDDERLKRGGSVLNDRDFEEEEAVTLERDRGALFRRRRRPLRAGVSSKTEALEDKPALRTATAC